MAPVGAWASNFLPTQILLLVFICFLFFSGAMMIFFKGSKYANQYREDRPLAGPVGVGVLAGFVSGLLGVGGGGIISPLMVVQGFNPKKSGHGDRFFSTIFLFFGVCHLCCHGIGVHQNTCFCRVGWLVWRISWYQSDAKKDETRKR